MNQYRQQQSNAPPQEQTAPGPTVTAISNLEKVLKETERQEQLSRLIPPEVRSTYQASRLVETAMGALRNRPELHDALATQKGQQSFIEAVATAASLGLEPSGPLGQGYFVPYQDEIKFIIGYRGLIALAYRSGEVSKIWAKVVYKGEKLDVEEGTQPEIHHKPSLASVQKWENIVAVYSVAKLRNGETMFEIMPIEEVQAIRAAAKSARSKYSPWNNVHFCLEMARKCPVRKLSKYLPMSSPVWAKALEVDDSDYETNGAGPLVKVSRPLGQQATKPAAQVQPLIPTDTVSPVLSDVHFKPEEDPMSGTGQTAFMPGKTPPALSPSQDGFVPDDWAEQNHELEAYEKYCAGFKNGKKALGFEEWKAAGRPAAEPQKKMHPGEKALIKELSNRIVTLLRNMTGESIEMAKKPESRTKGLLRQFSGFTDEETGVYKEGFDSFEHISGSWIQATYGKIKIAWLGANPGRKLPWESEAVQEEPGANG